jgi:hypothetical protein
MLVVVVVVVVVMHEDMHLEFTVETAETAATLELYEGGGCFDTDTGTAIATGTGAADDADEIEQALLAPLGKAEAVRG